MFRPNIISLRSTQDIHGLPNRHGRIFHRVKYFGFNNCGDLSRMLDYFQQAQRVFPRCLVRRCIWQVTHALHFMHSQCSPPVQHRDLRLKNSKFNPSFSLASTPVLFLGIQGLPSAIFEAAPCLTAMPLIWLQLFMAGAIPCLHVSYLHQNHFVCAPITNLNTTVFISWDANSTLPDFYLADFGQDSLDLLSIREGEFAPNGNRDVQLLYMGLRRLLECTGKISLPSGARSRRS